MEEKQFLEGLFEGYIKSPDSSNLRMMREQMVKQCEPYLKPTFWALEFGCEVGYMTSLIRPLVGRLDVLEGSKSFLQEAQKRVPGAHFYEKLFEELEAEEIYDCAFMSHVVEHMKDPRDVLKRAYRALKKGGFLFVTVPNARCASRQLAQCMHLLEDLYALTPNDVRGGHRRVYDRAKIVEEVARADFQIFESKGIFFKPFCDAQLDTLIDTGFLREEHIEGMITLGERYPDLCADIFVVGRKM